MLTFYVVVHILLLNTITMCIFTTVGEDYLDFGPIALRYRGREDMFTFDVTILNDTIAEPIVFSNFWCGYTKPSFSRYNYDCDNTG